MSIFKKILGGQTQEIVDSAGKIIDNLSTSDQEKLNAKNELTEIVSSKLAEIASYQRDVMLVEMQGSWLQRNWRPMVMIAFAFIIIYRYFLSQVFQLPAIELPGEFWSLLEIGLGGYVIGRSVEKVSDTVTKNVDMPFLKKKNRKV